MEQSSAWGEEAGSDVIAVTCGFIKSIQTAAYSKVTFHPSNVPEAEMH